MNFQKRLGVCEGLQCWFLWTCFCSPYLLTHNSAGSHERFPTTLASFQHPLLRIPSLPWHSFPWGLGFLGGQWTNEAGWLRWRKNQGKGYYSMVIGQNLCVIKKKKRFVFVFVVSLCVPLDCVCMCFLSVTFWHIRMCLSSPHPPVSCLLCPGHFMT